MLKGVVRDSYLSAERGKQLNAFNAFSGYNDLREGQLFRKHKRFVSGKFAAQALFILADPERRMLFCSVTAAYSAGLDAGLLKLPHYIFSHGCFVCSAEAVVANADNRQHRVSNRENPPVKASDSQLHPRSCNKLKRVKKLPRREGCFAARIFNIAAHYAGHQASSGCSPLLAA